VLIKEVPLSGVPLTKKEKQACWAFVLRFTSPSIEKCVCSYVLVHWILTGYINLGALELQLAPSGKFMVNRPVPNADTDA
jgi:hypothetical protein